MSTVKTASLRSFISMFLLLISFSCNQTTENKSSSISPEEITFIGISNVGGQMGNYRIVKITKDSIHLETGIEAGKKHKEWHKAIDSKTWKKLISSFKIKDLSLIKSSPSIQGIDGIDETFQIKTTKNSHVFVNAYNDVRYRQFENLKNQLNIILPRESQ